MVRYKRPHDYLQPRPKFSPIPSSEAWASGGAALRKQSPVLRIMNHHMRVALERKECVAVVWQEAVCAVLLVSFVCSDVGVDW